MTRIRPVGRAAGLLLFVLAFIVAACGGATTSGGPSGSAGTAASAAPSAAASAPAVTPSAVASTGAASSEPSMAALPSFDISSLEAGLANLDSYQVAISVNGAQTFSAVVVTKPELARKITTPDGQSFIVIGKQAWMSDDGTTWTAVPSAMEAALLSGFDPSLLVAAFSGPGWAQSSQSVGHEDKNGVSATHYKIDSSSLAAGFTGVPAGAEVNLWIADDGYLVALEATGFAEAENLTIEVTKVNDPANKVEAPS